MHEPGHNAEADVMDTHIAPASPSTTAPSRTPFTVLFAVLLITLIARQVFAIWEQYDGSMSYDELRGFGDAFWPMNLLVFGPGFAIGFVAQAILVWQLGRGRGRIITWIGAALVLIGGVLFALVATAHALPFDWAANHGILDDETGVRVVEAFNSSGTPLLVPYIVGSQALIGLGALAATCGARASGTIPTWMLIATVVFLIAFFLVPTTPGSAVEMILSFGQMTLWGALGWFGWRAIGRS
jgi:hypothetical protein